MRLIGISCSHPALLLAFCIVFTVQTGCSTSPEESRRQLLEEAEFVPGKKYELAKNYVTGMMGFPKDTEKAKSLFREAAANGDRRADAALAEISALELGDVSDVPGWGSFHAIVIGNSYYPRRKPKEPDTSLRSPALDASAIGDLLEKRYGFKVRRLVDKDSATIRATLNEYRNELREHTSLLIYFAGHGVLDPRSPQEGYWVPRDAGATDYDAMISNTEVKRIARAVASRHVLVVADSCFSGTLIEKEIEKVKRPLRVLHSLTSRLAITSGAVEQVADRDDENPIHSPFASAFIDVLSKNQGNVSHADLFKRIKSNLAGHLPTPQVGIIDDHHSGGAFVFVSRTGNKSE